MKLLNLKEVAEILSVNKQTLRLWDSKGTLKALRTKGGHRRYREADVLALIGEDSSIESEKNSDVVVVYCRVSSNDQK